MAFKEIMVFVERRRGAKFEMFSFEKFQDFWGDGEF